MRGQKTLVVIGGGAAGFFCAVNAARLDPDLKVILLEKTGKLLQKVKISGGGRCNTTHHLFDISPFSKCYPRGEKFLKKALHHFGPADTVQWFAERGVNLKAEPDGRMFPVTDNSQTIIDCLLKESERFGVEIRLFSIVVKLEKQNATWQLTLQDGRMMEADFVCVACGGFPKSEQFGWLTKATGHSISTPVPSLFTFNTPGNPITSLMGVSQKAHVKIAGTKFEAEGPVLVTHWGLSGPAILRTSAFAARELAAKDYQFEVIINWMPLFNENSLREKILLYRQEKGNKKVMNTEWFDLPDRLLKFLLESCEIDSEQRWADLPAAKQNKLIKALTAFSVPAKGKTTFKDEFVTAGGISLHEIDPNSMQSKLNPGLYFAGEIMDVDGVTGGFNFQHAWTSGMIAARHIAGV
jgi:hypothetical protein